MADDWADRWRAFHRPLTVAGRVHVRPPWAPPPPGGLVDVVIDPGRAFGTGAHATTKLSLELLVALAHERVAAEATPASLGSLLDLGCGSGVLAIAAANLGFAPVAALDHDPLAVQATADNARANGVALELRRSDLRAEPLPAGSMTTVLANLLRPLLLVLADRLPDRPPRTLIASGLLAGEADEIAAAFAARGLRERDRRLEGEWAALALSSAGTG